MARIKSKTIIEITNAPLSDRQQGPHSPPAQMKGAIMGPDVIQMGHKLKTSVVKEVLA